jgi:hypothetical protein
VVSSVEEGCGTKAGPGRPSPSLSVFAAMRLVKLANGRSIPQCGFGVGTKWFKKGADVKFDPACVESIQEALKAGFRHLDLAEM